jgi:predicted nucleotidyltransferase
MLSKKETMIFDELASRVCLQLPAARIWAFGSRARGDATGEIDLDICVVVQRLTDESEIAVMDAARQIGSDHDVIITTVVYSQEEFASIPRSESGLIHYILYYGIAARRCL